MEERGSGSLSKESNLQRCQAEFFSQDDILSVVQQINQQNDGFLSFQEAKQAMNDLRLRVSETDLRSLFDQLQRESHNNGQIPVDQFTRMVQQRQSLLAEVFCEINATHTGSLHLHEIQDALKKRGINIAREKILNLIEALDTNEEGLIDFDEFCRSFLLSPEIVQSGYHSKSKAHLVEKKDQDEDAAWKILLSGGVAGAVSRTATAPFDRLKVLLQAGGSVGGKQVNGIVPGLRAILEEGGIRAFFRGNGTNVIKIAPESAVKFFAYERIKMLVSHDPANLTGRERFIAGALAGVIAQTSIYPLEVTKTRLAVAPTGTYRGISDCLLKIYRGEGPRALFRGLGTSISGIIPYAGVEMSIFFSLKESWMHRHPDESPGVVTLLAMGAASSTCGQVTAYPLQLVRTRLQAQGIPGRPDKYAGMMDCFAKVYKERGIKGFYRGIIPNFMKAIPAISISYVVYEKTRQILRA